MKFDTLFKSFVWKPIRGCPGRYVFHMPGTHLSPVEILGGAHTMTAHSSPKARDRILIAKIDDGALISYQRQDGSFVNTLNSVEGFERKLAQLGLATVFAEERAEKERGETDGGCSK